MWEDFLVWSIKISTLNIVLLNNGNATENGPTDFSDAAIIGVTIDGELF